MLVTARARGQSLQPRRVHGTTRSATWDEQRSALDRWMDVCGVVQLTFIYFLVYWHHWFVALLQGYVVNTLLPIVGLLMVASVRASRRMLEMNGKSVSGSIGWPLIPLVMYVVVACISVVLNEETADGLRSYLIYVLSPPLVFLGVYGTFRSVPRPILRQTLVFLLVCGVAASVYVVIVYGPQDETRLAEIAPLETNRGVIHGAISTGATYGIGSYDTIFRFRMPGINPTTFGSMLVLPMLIALSLAGATAGRMRLIYCVAAASLGYCALMTVSRGPVLAGIAGLAYLAWSKQLSKGLLWVTISAMIISAATFAQLTLARLLLSVPLLPSTVTAQLPDWARWLRPSDGRLDSMPETLSIIADHPWIGIGMTRLVGFGEVFLDGAEHNNYLKIAAAFGLVAFACYATVVASFLVRIALATRRAAPGSSERTLLAIAGAGAMALAAYLHAAQSEYHFIWVWFGLSAAIVVRCAPAAKDIPIPRSHESMGQRARLGADPPAPVCRSAR